MWFFLNNRETCLIGDKNFIFRMIVEYLVEKQLVPRKRVTVSLIKVKSCNPLSRMLLTYNHSYAITGCVARGWRKEIGRIKLKKTLTLVPAAHILLLSSCDFHHFPLVVVHIALT